MDDSLLHQIEMAKEDFHRNENVRCLWEMLTKELRLEKGANLGAMHKAMVDLNKKGMDAVRFLQSSMGDVVGVPVGKFTGSEHPDEGGVSVSN